MSARPGSTFLPLYASESIQIPAPTPYAIAVP